MSKPKPSELAPVDWNGIEPHFKAGIRSMVSISKEFGVSRAGILKHAAKQKPPWKRNLKPQIIARAAELVTEQVAEAVTPPGSNATEIQTIEVNAKALAMVQHAHRTIAAEARSIGVQLLAELAGATKSPELFARVIDALEHLEDEPDAALKADMREVISIASRLPQRANVFKTLVEALSKVQGMEREAFGLNAEDGTGKDRFTVIIKDYTGRGSAEAPPKPDHDEDN